MPPYVPFPVFLEKLFIRVYAKPIAMLLANSRTIKALAHMAFGRFALSATISNAHMRFTLMPQLATLTSPVLGRTMSFADAAFDALVQVTVRKVYSRALLHMRAMRTFVKGSFPCTGVQRGLRLPFISPDITAWRAYNSNGIIPSRFALAHTLDILELAPKIDKVIYA